MIYYAPLFLLIVNFAYIFFFHSLTILVLRCGCSCRRYLATHFIYEGIMKKSNKLWRKALLSITAGLLISQSAVSYAARCEYVIQNEWATGFTAAVRIK